MKVYSKPMRVTGKDKAVTVTTGGMLATQSVCRFRRQTRGGYVTCDGSWIAEMIPEWTYCPYCGRRVEWVQPKEDRR